MAEVPLQGSGPTEWQERLHILVYGIVVFLIPAWAIIVWKVLVG
jgi:hypothetical protein